MKPRKAAPLRRHLLLLALAGLLPVALFAATGLVLLYGERKDAAQNQALATTRALATAVKADLERSISALATLATLSALDGPDTGDFEVAARRALDAQPHWQIVSLADPQGRQVVNTFFAPGVELPQTQLEPESFRAVVATGRPAVGSLVPGRKGHAFPVRVPVIRDGRVRYVLTAVVSPAAIVEILRRQGVPDDSVISVFDSRLTRVARSRSHERYIATKAGKALHDLMAEGRPEGTGTTQVLEGGEVFTAYSRVPTWGWVVAMGLPISVFHATALRSVALVALALALSLLTGILAARYLTRRINESMVRLCHAADALGAGVHPPTSGSEISEIDAVGASLAQASARLAAANAQRDESLHREQVARTQAEQANRAKDEFLAMLGHELRNPLSALSNAIELVDHPDGESRAKARAVLRRQTDHLVVITDDLLDAARAVMNKIEIRPQPVDLSAITANALHVLATTQRTSKHRLAARLQEAWIVGDPVRIDQIVGNLVINAVKYTPEGKSIVVSVERIGVHARLQVKDEGEGMSPELAARAFDLFVQGRRRIDRAQGGLGIGLTLVKALAELHGGSAHVHSDGEGRGSTFTVDFPAIECPAEIAAPAVVPADPMRILVIEDNPDARDTLQMLLQCLGHDVRCAGDGEKGLEFFREWSPDVALVDLGLPGMDGYEVARRVRAQGDGAVRLFALTGYGSADDRARSLEAGFDEHLIKPLDVTRFAQLLAGWPRRAPAPGE